MQIAFLVTPKNKKLIETLNHGVGLHPDFVQECITLRPCYFIWDDDTEVHEFIGREQFLEDYNIQSIEHGFVITKK